MTFLPPLAPGLDWSSRNTFSTNGLDRRSDLRETPDAMATAFADPRMRLLAFAGDRILIKDRAAADGRDRAYAVGAEARELARELSEPIFLGFDGARVPWFAGEFVADPELEPGERLSDLRSLALAATVEPETYGPAAQARSLLFWHRRHKFCGSCGAPTKSASAGYQRVCTVCGTTVFPRIDPVAIMLISHGDRALLGRTPRFEAGMYTCLAGFIEPGETPEDAVRREVHEESGIAVGPVHYHSSQPWPFPANLMLGFFGEAVSEEIQVDHAEMEDCRWFHRDEVRALLDNSGVGVLHGPPKLAVARVLIETWARG